MEQELEVVRIDCTLCGHYVLYKSDNVPSLEDRKCQRCYVEPGHARKVRQWRHCAQCNLTLLDDDMCYCPEQKGITIIKDPKHQWMKDRHYNQREEEIEISKAERKKEQEIKAYRIKQDMIPEEMLKELRKQNKKEEPQPVKRYSGHAIQ